MPEDLLRNLLQRADDDAGAATIGADLAGRTLRRARRTAVARWALAISIAVAVGASGWAWTVIRRDDATLAGPTSPQQDRSDLLRAERARLEAKADLAVAIAAHMIAAEQQRSRLREARRRLDRIDPDQQLQRHVDDAARTMVWRADRLERELNLRAKAIATYRQTIALFPRTAWATVARKRLQRLTHS